LQWLFAFSCMLSARNI